MRVVDGDVLTKVVNYRLQRPDLGSVDIQVHRIIGEKIEEEFVAMPVQSFPIDSTKKEYMVYGKSEEEVLQQLIDKVDGVHKHDLFDKSTRANKS